jgi:hypothetical protein
MLVKVIDQALGKDKVFPVESTMTVRDLKVQIASAFEVPEKSLLLFCHGGQLDDSHTLEMAEVQPGTTIRAQYRQKTPSTEIIVNLPDGTGRRVHLEDADTGNTLFSKVGLPTSEHANHELVWNGVAQPLESHLRDLNLQHHDELKITTELYGAEADKSKTYI